MARCPTCNHYSCFERNNMHYGKPIHNDKYMHKEEFLKYYACDECRKTAGWVDVKWGTGALLSEFVSARCSYCGYELHSKISDLRLLNDMYNITDQMKEMDKKMEALKRSPWNTKYYDSPCPYCGSMKVRPIKWSDKRLSVAFWGLFGSNIGDKYKCDNCKKSWE